MASFKFIQMQKEDEMTDPRMQKLADVLVNYSTKVGPGDWVGISGDASAIDGLRAIYAAVVQAGGNPMLLISDEQMARTFLRDANDEQLNWISPTTMQFYEEGDVFISLRSTTNTRAMTNIDAKRAQQVQAARRPICVPVSRPTPNASALRSPIFLPIAL